MKKTRRSPYPSDITREQFELIRPLLESARKKTKPRQLDLYDMFCAVLKTIYSAATEEAGLESLVRFGEK